MFKDNTVFVIGAGASTEYGAFAGTPLFPVGTGLRSMIKAGCSYGDGIAPEVADGGDRVVYGWLKQRYGYGEPEFLARLEALRKIAKRIEAFDSIDECIDHLADPHVTEMGKIMIARYLAEAETKCLLGTQRDKAGFVQISALTGTWLESFVRVLMNGRRDPDDIGKEITIICFNYDRCIEFYLINAIIQRYEISYQQAHRIVSNMAIIHPYGTLGKLPENPYRLPHEVPFAPAIDADVDPWDTIIGLKTYTERVDDTATMHRMTAALHGGAIIMFLGFGFTSENMKLLNTTLHGYNGAGSRAFRIATGKGQHRDSDGALRLKIAHLFPGSWSLGDLSIIIAYDQGCADTFRAHYHNISA
jgi:hypothetical protein